MKGIPQPTNFEPRQPITPEEKARLALRLRQAAASEREEFPRATEVYFLLREMAEKIEEDGE